MTEQSTITVDPDADASWAVEFFTRFWGDPETRESNIPPLAADIIGRWPDGSVVQGVEDYMGRLIKIGTLIPDLRLDVLESAVNGKLAFIRWRGYGTGTKGSFELFGVDRLLVERGEVKENIVHFDTATFASVVGVPFAAA